MSKIINIDSQTGAIEFKRTPEEEETIALKDRIAKLEKLLNPEVKEELKEADKYDEEVKQVEVKPKKVQKKSGEEK